MAPLKAFISYSTQDGTEFAEQARVALEGRGHSPWLWDYNGAVGSPLWREIAHNIIDSDAMWFICTPESINSNSQTREAGIALLNGVTVLTIAVDGASVPPELSADVYERTASQGFGKVVERIVGDLSGIVERAKASRPRRSEDDADLPLEMPTPAELETIRRMNRNRDGLDPETVSLFITGTADAYLKATMVRDIATVAPVERTDVGLVNFARRIRIPVDRFNAENTSWRMFVADVARAVAKSEDRHVFKHLNEDIVASGRSISRTAPDFSALKSEVERLVADGFSPNRVVVPISVFIEFSKQLMDDLDWTDVREVFRWFGHSMRVYWSHKWAPLDSVVVFDANAGIWSVALDPETNLAYTIGLGRDMPYPDEVTYSFTVRAKYTVAQPEGFSRLPVGE